MVFRCFFAFACIWLICGCRNTNSDEKSVEPEKVIVHEKIESPVLLKTPAYMVTGKVGYDRYCLSCHQESGGGVSGLNPPLSKTEYVTGDKSRLLSIVIQGSNVGLEINGATYANAMPSFDYLADEEIADITSYIRNSFGNSASIVTVEEVAALRKVR